MTFRFRCYRDFKLQLGSIDALAECMEIALRHFIVGAAKAPAVAQFVAEVSKESGIRVDTVNLSTLQNHAAHLYIVGVHQGFEEFLIAFKKGHPSGSSWKFDKDLDRLRNTLDAIKGKATLEYNLCQHYREIRNAFVHSEVRIKSPKGEGLLEKLREKVLENEAYNRLKAPNEYNTSNFDDFILYSRAAKKLAEDFCIMAKPSEEELAGLARQYFISNGEHARLKNNPARLQRRLAGFLHTEYSLEPDEASKIARMAV